MDRYSKIVLTVIAVCLTIQTAQIVVRAVAPKALAQSIVPVQVMGGRLDYETDSSGGPTLKVCTQC